MTALSRFIEHGNLHLATVLLSLLSGIVIYSVQRRRTLCDAHSKSANEVRRSESAYIITRSIAAAAAFSLSLHHSAWRESFALGYVFLLGLSQPMVKSQTAQTTIRHQVNVVTFIMTLLEAVELLLPLSVIGASVSSRIEMVKLMPLAVAAMITFITPRRVRYKKSNVEDVVTSSEDDPSAEETCSWFSYYVSYDWLTYLILRGLSRDLQISDLPLLPSYDAPLKLLARMSGARLGGSRTFHTLVKAFRWEIGSIMVWSVLTATVEYTAAFAMFNLLAYLEDPASTGIVVHPFVWIALLFIGPMTRSVCYQQSIFKSTRLMVLWRAAVLQEIYQKMLGSRSQDAILVPDKSYGTPAADMPPEKPAGKFVKMESLVSYDADMISNASDMFYAFTASFVSAAVAMTFLYLLLGWPSLVGIAVMICMTPLPAIFSQRMSRLHRHVMEATDLRLGRISEYLHLIRPIKYFAWEDMVVQNINRIRLTEQQRIWKRNLTSMLVSMTGDMLSLVSLLAMFASLILFTDRRLYAPTAFTSLAVTETLRSQFVWMCKVIQWASQARGSLKRVDSFLDAAEERRRPQSGLPAFKNATVRWSPLSPFVLRDISLTFREGALNVIHGSTGSGKSLLLLALLGETCLESGKMSCPTDVAYVPQTAWLQSTSIRGNILFYSPYDEERYNAVLHACDLLDDLSRLPLRDATQVGERGSALSGGQKQRISLARALYSQASTLLLDDIFSALDARTTSRVYERCFQTGLLAGRTVILVTHLPSALQDAHFLVSLDEFVTSQFSQAKLNGVIRLEATEFNPNQNRNVESIYLDDDTTEVSCKDQSILETQEHHSDEKQASGRVPRRMSKFAHHSFFSSYNTVSD